MEATFESLVPVFLLILCGNVLHRARVVEPAGWDGINQLGYWFFYPALIFITIADADFAGLQLDRMAGALAIALPLMFAFVLALWPILGRRGLIKASEYSSVFQTSVRWNGFMALAIAQKLFAPAGMTIVALVMAIIILPINLMTVYVVTRFADGKADLPTVARRILSNPMVIAAGGGVLMHALPFGLYAPLDKTLQLIGQASLGLGLVGIGAGLRLTSLVKPRVAVLLPVVAKLAVFPLVLLAIAVAFGIDGQQLLYLVLCGAVPTAMNGYVLAKQMGGDAELYATVTTLQTLLSFFSIPAVLAFAAQFTGG